MIANRISFFFGLVGPSTNLDSACTSSCTALEYAYEAITSGRCENAIVGGSNLVLHPHMSLQMNFAGKYSEILSSLLLIDIFITIFDDLRLKTRI